MRRIVLALVVGIGAALCAAAPAIADDPAPTTKPAVTSGAPVVVSGTADVITTAPATRRGLLARFRDRRTGASTVTMPMPATGTIVTPTPSTTVPTPMPKPGVTPAGGTTTMTPMVTTAAYTTVQPARTGLFSRMRNRNTMTVVPMTTVVEPMPMPMNAVVPASGTVMMPAATMEMTTPTTRMGLLARLRARR